MQDKFQVQHLSRSDKKLLVKGWHSQEPPKDATSGSISDCEKMTPSWSMKSLFAPPPGALAYEAERAMTWRSTSDSTMDEENLSLQIQQPSERKQKLLKTVAQVKCAYRARARKEEAQEVAKEIRRQHLRHELRTGLQKQDRDKQQKLQPQQVVEVHQSVDKEENNEELDDGELRLVNLTVDDIVANAEFRQDILRQIRHHLADGGSVLLQSDCNSDPESVRSTRFMMQTLCTQSLAYCVRDQDVVPESLTRPDSTRLVLRLMPRHQPLEPQT
ncbi:Nitrogen permease regulator-like 3 [Phytophthora boehmeriae]|uniref:Nitrogen permease regulator-like 3 n=1 Tax=Phytophthora boehmeriae TaxID=109152 RepID=A0A8T1VYI3_9STRA|nr:Nitrogen permease regulator-like 3 [Phytophthora boehmeriae]